MSLALTVFVAAVFVIAGLGWMYALHLAVRHWRLRNRSAPSPAPRPESPPRSTRLPRDRELPVITASELRSGSPRSAVGSRPGAEHEASDRQVPGTKR